MICFSRPYHLKNFNGYLSQVLLGLFFNTLSHLYHLTSSRSCKRSHLMLLFMPAVFSFMPVQLIIVGPRYYLLLSKCCKCCLLRFLFQFVHIAFPAYTYLFKVNNGNLRKRCEICLKLTIKTPVTLICCLYFYL